MTLRSLPAALTNRPRPRTSPNVPGFKAIRFFASFGFFNPKRMGG